MKYLDIEASTALIEILLKRDLGEALPQLGIRGPETCVVWPRGERSSGTVRHRGDRRLSIDSPQFNISTCAVLGAEIGSLPSEVGSNTRVFFERNIEWLRIAFMACRLTDAKARSYAIHVLSSLEGAMIVSKTMSDDSVFESVAKTLSRLADL